MKKNNNNKKAQHLQIGIAGTQKNVNEGYNRKLLCNR
jgi:hypothetical protein